jgi:hypothetical protein
MRSFIRYEPPDVSDHHRKAHEYGVVLDIDVGKVDQHGRQARSSPLVTADAQRACYSGAPAIPALAEYFERRRAHSRRIAEVRKRMQARHEAFGS